MKGFWKDLLQKKLSRQWLEGLRSVPLFSDCFVAKKLDRRLLDLGATPIVQRGLEDDHHPSGYEAALDPWMASLWNMLNKIGPNYLPNGPDFLIPYENFMAKPKVRILYHDIDKVDSQVSSKSDLNHMALQIERACRMSPLAFSLDRSDCILKLVKDEPLTKSGCKDKEVHCFEFEFVSSPIPYEVADVLEVLPSQNPAAVDAFILRCNLDPESFITVHPSEMENQLPDTCIPIKLKTFVELTMDVASASSRRYFFEAMSMFASAEHEKERLQYLVSPEGRDDPYQYNQRERRTVLEVLEDFPSVQMPFEWLVQLVPPLKSVYIPVSFQKGSLPPPRPSLPLILIGPGTGCAPFVDLWRKDPIKA